VDIYSCGRYYRQVIRQMKRKDYAVIVGSAAVIVISVVVLLLDVSTGDEVNTVAGQPVPWSVLIFLSVVAFLGMAVLTYRMLSEPENSKGGDSHDG
jgi:uncharacterized protein involved in response to NO